MLLMRRYSHRYGIFSKITFGLDALTRLFYHGRSSLGVRTKTKKKRQKRKKRRGSFDIYRAPVLVISGLFLVVWAFSLSEHLF